MKKLTAMDAKIIKLSLVACAAAFGLALAGCSQKEEAARVPAPAPKTAMPKLPAASADNNTPPPPGAETPAPAAADTAAQPVNQEPATDESVKKALDSLNAAVGGFKAELGRSPASIEELMRKGFWMTRLPASPEGKKFWFDTQKNQVVLVDRKPGEVDPEPPTAEEARQAAIQSAIEFRNRQQQAQSKK